MRPIDALLPLALFLAACGGGETTDATDDTSDTDETSETDVEETDDTDVDETDETDDTESTDDTDDVVVEAPFGLEGTWSGTLSVDQRTQGSFNGTPFDNTSSCADGTMSFSLDLSRAPQLQLESISCSLDLGTVDLTGTVSSDEAGDPSVVSDQVGVAGTLTSDRFPGGSLNWSGTFHDDDADGKADRFTSYASGQVSTISSPTGSAATTLTALVEATPDAAAE